MLLVSVFSALNTLPKAPSDIFSIILREYLFFYFFISIISNFYNIYYLIFKLIKKIK